MTPTGIGGSAIAPAGPTADLCLEHGAAKRRRRLPRRRHVRRQHGLRRRHSQRSADDSGRDADGHAERRFRGLRRHGACPDTSRHRHRRRHADDIQRHLQRQPDAAEQRRHPCRRRDDQRRRQLSGGKCAGGAVDHAGSADRHGRQRDGHLRRHAARSDRDGHWRHRREPRRGFPSVQQRPLLRLSDAHHVVVATYAGSTNYKTASGSGTLDITQATPTVQVTGGTFVYDGRQRIRRPDPSAERRQRRAARSTHVCAYSVSGSPAQPINANTYDVVALLAGQRLNGAVRPRRRRRSRFRERHPW